ENSVCVFGFFAFISSRLLRYWQARLHQHRPLHPPEMHRTARNSLRASGVISVMDLRVRVELARDWRRGRSRLQHFQSTCVSRPVRCRLTQQRAYPTRTWRISTIFCYPFRNRRHAKVFRYSANKGKETRSTALFELAHVGGEFRKCLVSSTVVAD